jgi:hypothetical protein
MRWTDILCLECIVYRPGTSQLIDALVMARQTGHCYLYTLQMTAGMNRSIRLEVW